MKVTKEHFAKLKKEVESLLEKYPDTEIMYSKGLFPNSEKTKDLQMRFCFDIFYSTTQELRNEFIDYNDEHIYTALRKCCPTIIKRY